MCSDRLRLKVSAGARRVVLRRSGGACDGCGIEWPWILHLFRVDATAPPASRNLTVLCPACAGGREEPSAPLVLEPSLRERLRLANNMRTGAAKLTPARRKRLIATRGSRCEICGVPAGERQLDVHHRRGILQGGDDAEDNLMVLCFVCHHHLQRCVTGCGRWARKPAGLCRHCETRRRLERMYPELTWDEIKARFAALTATWPPGYEPRSPGA